MHPDVLLENDCIGELLLADGTGVLHPQWRQNTVDAVVRFEVPFGGECSAAHFAPEWPFPRVRAVVHFQGALAAEHPVTDDTFVWVAHFLVDVFDQPL